MKKTDGSADVLVSVLKDPRDLELLLTEKWYRIPYHFAPKRAFSTIAFYQPAVFKDQGKQIEYFATIQSCALYKRVELLPDQPDHPRAQERYCKYSFSEIQQLAHPIRNIIPRRVSFGFTSLERLQSAADLLELYDVAPIEQMMVAALRQLGISVVTEYPISYSCGRFRIDLAIACRDGLLAVECDNTASHRTAAQKRKDAHKDAVLKHHGWRMVRLSEEEVLGHSDTSVARVKLAIASLGGLAPNDRSNTHS